MRDLGPRDFRALLECLRETYALSDLAAFPRHVVGILRRLVPAEWAWCDGAHPARGRTMWVVEPFDTFPDAQRIFSAYMHEHPCFLHEDRIPDARAWRLSDFLARRQLHQLGLYNEYYRRRGVEYQIGIRLTASPLFVIAVGVNRGPRQRDFSDGHLLSMTLLGPHLVAAYRNAAILATLRTELEEAGRAEGMTRGVVIAARGRAPSVSTRARALLERYLDWSPRRSRALPDVLTRWIANQLSVRGRRDDVPKPPEALVIARGGHRLWVRLLTDARQHVLLLDERAPQMSPDRLAKLGLTAREAEVLTWVAQGKTNQDAASILGIRPATIAKHLERIFRKLGVETRTAAAARAFEVRGPEPLADC